MCIGLLVFIIYNICNKHNNWVYIPTDESKWGYEPINCQTEQRGGGARVATVYKPKSYISGPIIAIKIICEVIKTAVMIRKHGEKRTRNYTTPEFVNGLHLYSVFPASGHSKCFTILPSQHSPVHAHIHTPTAVSTTQGDSQLVRSS